MLIIKSPVGFITQRNLIIWFKSVFRLSGGIVRGNRLESEVVSIVRAAAMCVLEVLFCVRTPNSVTPLEIASIPSHGVPSLTKRCAYDEDFIHVGGPSKMQKRDTTKQYVTFIYDGEMQSPGSPCMFQYLRRTVTPYVWTGDKGSPESHVHSIMALRGY